MIINKRRHHTMAGTAAIKKNESAKSSIAKVRLCIRAQAGNKRDSRRHHLPYPWWCDHDVEQGSVSSLQHLSLIWGESHTIPNCESRLSEQCEIIPALKKSGRSSSLPPRNLFKELEAIRLPSLVACVRQSFSPFRLLSCRGTGRLLRASFLLSFFHPILICIASGDRNRSALVTPVVALK